MSVGWSWGGRITFAQPPLVQELFEVGSAICEVLKNLVFAVRDAGVVELFGL